VSVRATATVRCVICGSRNAEHNHVGGRNHVAWFTMPFCREHHEQFHALLRNAGINLEYTSDARERLLRGIKACLVAQWILTEALQKLGSQNEKETGEV
jgi:hypothetical protein